MVLGWIIAIPMDETSRIAFWRHAQWPGHVMAETHQRPGGLRSQFHHIIDIAPTILELAGIPEPREVNGVPQMPIEGISMAYTFADKDAPGRRVTQYFEMFGNRALYHDGWVAGCLHGRAPWRLPAAPASTRHLGTLQHEDDFRRRTTLLPQEPKKLRDLQDRFMAEARQT
jgi:arylsulfatase